MTPSTTTCRRGEVVLVPFQFSERPIFKSRPAVIISSDTYHAGRSDVVIAAITSRIRRPLLVGDHRIIGWQQSGLQRPSVATAILRTVKVAMIARKLGVLAERDMRAVTGKLRQSLDI